MKSKVYVGSSLFNADEVKSVMSNFVSAGLEISYDWTKHGQGFTEEELSKYFTGEFNGVVNCDLFFMIHPARNGTHVEMGIALALNKPIVMVEKEGIEMKPFYYAPNVTRFKDLSNAMEYTIKQLIKER